MSGDQRGDQDGDDVDHLDHRVDRRPGGVLAGVSDGVPGHRGGVGLGSLAAEVALLDVLLGVVPGGTAGCHLEGQEEPHHDRPDQEAAQCDRAQDEPDQDGSQYRDQAGQDHLPLGGPGDDRDAASVEGPSGALHDPRDLPELAPNLLDHSAGRSSHRLHRERGKEDREHAAEEQPRDHPGVAETEVEVVVAQGQRVAGEENQGRQRGGPDRVALGHRLGGFANRVQRVGDRPDRVRKVCHLGDATGVVGDRPIGVDRHHDPHHAEQAHGGDGDAVEAGQGVGAEDPDSDQEGRRRGRL